MGTSTFMWLLIVSLLLVINADENTCPFDGAGNDSPTPEKPDTPENPESGACEDGHKACSSKKHICGNDMYAPMMVSKCPKTCNACEAATHGPNSSAKCKDTSFMCARKSIKDACDKEENKKLCPFTCKTCK